MCGIVGSALGMAIYGLRPVAEMEFLDLTGAVLDKQTATVGPVAPGQVLALHPA